MNERDERHHEEADATFERVLDELEIALAPADGDEADDASTEAQAAKEALFRRTARQVRARRGRRRAVLAVAGVLLFATGFGLAEWIAASRRPFIHIEVRDAAGRTTTRRTTPFGDAASGDAPIEERAQPRDGGDGAADPAGGATADPNGDDPARVERAAESASESERAALWRRAGDLWFEERGDVQGALRCYRRYLDEAESTATEVAAGSTDNWLLRDLMNGRRRGADAQSPAASNDADETAPERGDE